jgi:hypothetical protein
MDLVAIPDLLSAGSPASVCVTIWIPEISSSETIINERNLILGRMDIIASPGSVVRANKSGFI